MPNIPRLSPDLPHGTVVNFGGHTYYPGEEFLYGGNACQVLQFVSAAIDQVRAQHPELQWQAGVDANIDFWSELCELRHIVYEASALLSASRDSPIERLEVMSPDESF